jgi:hypothetical protein
MNGEIQTDDGYVVVGYVSRNWLISEPEAIANARLIAAAPELLAVCELVDKTCKAILCNGGSELWNSGMLEHLQDVSCKAIVKAKGGSE